MTLTETFYDNGVSLLNFEKTKLNREFALLSQDRARDQLCLNVTVDYYQYSANQQVRDVSEQQLRNLEKQFASVSDQYQQGFKTRADFLRLKTQVLRARLALVNAETDLANSIVQLRKDLGSTTEQGTEKIEFQTVDPSQLPTEIPTARSVGGSNL